VNDVKSLSLAQQVQIRRLGWTGHALCYDDLIVHNVLFSSVDAKWRGHQHTLVADVADDVRCVCTFANQDLSRPLKADNFNNAYSMFVHQAGHFDCFKCPTSTKPYMSEV